ncbi:CinA family protein [Rhodococcus sp. NPDC003318]|uniref:CinA family protein n=1 Tax=Rhodococcus sp. NPDC003318 TaxID=3364503 RepID=UPI0036C8B154
MSARDVADGSDRGRALCERLSDLATAGAVTVACAESLTSGAVASRLGAAPDSGDWFRGGIVAYSRTVKHSLLRVPEGPVVCEAAARAMAETAAELLNADIAVAVTGVGGPGEQDGRPPGTVWFGVAGRGNSHTEQRRFDGRPEEILEHTVLRALELLITRAESVVDPRFVPRRGG